MVSREVRRRQGVATVSVMELVPTGRTRPVTSYEWCVTYPDGRTELLWSPPEETLTESRFALYQEAAARWKPWWDMMLTREDWQSVILGLARDGNAADQDLAEQLADRLDRAPAGHGCLGEIPWPAMPRIWHCAAPLRNPARLTARGAPNDAAGEPEEGR